MLDLASSIGNRSMVVSALAQIEAHSAICRLRQGGLISPAEATMVIELLTEALKRTVEQPINPPTLEAARILVDRHVLRALDAIQLGSAIVSREMLAANDMRFVSADEALLKAAGEEGFETWNPATG